MLTPTLLVINPELLCYHSMYSLDLSVLFLLLRSDIDAVVDELIRTEKLITPSKVDQVITIQTKVSSVINTHSFQFDVQMSSSNLVTD